MRDNLIISNLSYDELILLQKIMMHIDESGEYIQYDVDLFESLYEKVMNA